MDIDAAALHCGIPRLTLQPLVENALVHGLSGMVGEWRIQIRGHVAGGCVRLAVCDNGCGMTPEQIDGIAQGEVRPGSNSIGIHNVDRRILLMYGEPYGLTFASEMGAGVTVTVSLPWKGNGNV